MAQWHIHIYQRNFQDMIASEAMVERFRKHYHFEYSRQFTSPVGPHPLPMHLIVLNWRKADFIPWLYKNKGELSILIHPMLDNEVAAHTTQAIWLGTPIPIDLEEV